MTEDELKKLLLQQGDPLAQASANIPPQDVPADFDLGQFAASLPAELTGVPAMARGGYNLGQGVAAGDPLKAALGLGEAALGGVPAGLGIRGALKAGAAAVPTKTVPSGMPRYMSKISMWGKPNRVPPASPGASQITGGPVRGSELAIQQVTRSPNPFYGSTAGTAKAKGLRRAIGQNDVLTGLGSAADKGKYIDDLNVDKLANSLTLDLKRMGVPVPKSIKSMAKKTKEALQTYKSLGLPLDDVERVRAFISKPGMLGVAGAATTADPILEALQGP